MSDGIKKSSSGEPPGTVGVDGRIGWLFHSVATCRSSVRRIFIKANRKQLLLYETHIIYIYIYDHYFL